MARVTTGPQAGASRVGRQQRASKAPTSLGLCWERPILAGGQIPKENRLEARKATAAGWS